MCACPALASLERTHVVSLVMMVQPELSGTRLAAVSAIRNTIMVMVMVSVTVSVIMRSHAGLIIRH